LVAIVVKLHVVSTFFGVKHLAQNG